MAKMKAGPIVSDNGNFIIDAPFPEQEMQDPLTVRYFALCFIAKEVLNNLPQLLTRVKMLTGVVEVGLFCHMAKAVYFGNEVCQLPSLHPLLY